MNTKTQIWIDRRIVKPFVSGTNIFVRLLGQLLRLNHSLDINFKTIAVCKYKGLGSIVQATPLLQTLRKKYPDARIVFISTKGNKGLLEKIDCIDETVLLDDSGFAKLALSYPGFVAKLISLRIGLFIDLEIYSNFSSLSTTLSMARNRIGFYLRASHYRMGVYTHMMYYNTSVPIMQTYLQMARLLGTPENEVVTSLYPFKTTDADSIEIPHLGKYIAININASDLRIERRWPLDQFERLVRAFRERYPEYHIVLIGAKNEADYVTQFHERFDDLHISSVAGKTTFNQLMSVLDHAELLITNDTGPLHLAASLGKPTVALFGPCAPVQYGAMDKVVPVYKELYCSPCVHEFDIPPCLGDNQCMKQIGTEQVMKAVEQAMTGDFAAPKKAIPFYSDASKALGEVGR